ncbi:MAG TPA: LysM peptidoglycan-binding domain-containing protein [Marisediminicola sp.]|nr:LysM peptidoglycan-binding domain-containing protein [Marisediminicola sp.]
MSGRNPLGKKLFTALPIVLAGSMAMSLTAPLTTDVDRLDGEREAPSELAKSIRGALAAAHAASTAEATSTGVVTPAAAAPSSYTVAAGDSVSGIAARFGVATASVLALNGLGWKSVIYPGQVLKLTSATSSPIAATPAPVASSDRYTIVAGDTIGRIAGRFGVSVQSILTANGLSWSSIIYPGSSLAIPGKSTTASVRQTPVAATPVASVSPPLAVTPAVSITPLSQTSHVISSGETVAGIAKAYGVSIQAILNANGLSWSSIIYSGRTLAIPAAAAAAPSTARGATPLSAEMARNASTIIAVGRSLGVSDYGLVVALATAMQESTLRNLDHGDRDSLGLFQQRPSQGWGTPKQVTDPDRASRLFFGGPSNPNAGSTRGLLDIRGWQSMTVTQAAQAVQLSAYPDAYAKWEVSAWAWLDQLG